MIIKPMKFIWAGVIVLMVSCTLPVSGALSTSSTNGGKAVGNQPIPLLMNNQFVLIPGDKAPFMKNNRLMVPLMTFARMIGAHVEERKFVDVQQNKIVQKKAYTIRPTPGGIYDEIGGLREGAANAVFGGDMGFGIGAAPEYRAGELFVPLTPILYGMSHSFDYEVRSIGRFRKTLAIMDPTLPRLLPQVQDPDVQLPEYASIMSDTPYPLIPIALTQHKIQSTNGTSSYRLRIEFERGDGLGERMKSIKLRIIAVDKNGGTATFKKELAPEEELTRTDVTDVPIEAVFVLVQAVPQYRTEPVYPTGYPLQMKLTQAVAKFYTKEEMFSSFSLRPVGVKIDAQEMALTVRGIARVHQAVTGEKIEALKQSIFEMVGRSFPLRIDIETRSEQPDITGTIASIDSAGRISIKPEAVNGGGAEETVWLGSPDSDIYIHAKDDETSLTISDLRVGMKVSAWISGEATMRDNVVHTQLRELNMH
ncbi:hypothetical protein [Paenibacillus lignilyticus]|uniref:Copper amine oxidase-like N-terminal domain-containing protein n=1 Tax=Paenibacillus lignilyticus TaxID=1172615 RepID=A0ABS5CCW8_9BACL|nr:hypothetical protein [Paenibacillus lignilyticus]MBP3963809.1 hypothetical protein [Paenibacillus lignilyticus]